VPRCLPKISHGLTWPLKMKIYLSSTERFSSYFTVNRVHTDYKNQSVRDEFGNHHCSHSVIRTQKFCMLHLVTHTVTTTLHSVELVSSMTKLQLYELWAAFERFYVPSLLQKFALALACFLSFKLLLASNISVIGRIYFIRTPGYESTLFSQS
jgi:hypothetical protein